MAFLAPKTAPGISVPAARVAVRFYFISIVLVAATLFLPHNDEHGTDGLIFVALLTAGATVFFAFFSWDKYAPRVFTLAYLLSSSFLTAMLVYFTGGMQSSYQLLFFLIIFSMNFFNQQEISVITIVVTLFYLVPYIYDRPGPYQLATSVVTVLLFFSGTYMLNGIAKNVHKNNELFNKLNAQCLNLSSLTADLLHSMGAGSVLDSFAETLKDHLPTTYCLVMLQDDNLNLITRIACLVRGGGEQVTGVAYTPDQLVLTRRVFETRQPQIYRFESDRVDDALMAILPKSTRSALVVPIRIGGENGGIMIFGEERYWDLAPFSNNKVQLAVAISKQIAAAVQMWRCHESLAGAKRLLQISYDKSVKAERLAALGEVTRAIEHEINNPLSVIVNWSEIYREDEAIDQEMRRKFQIIYDMATRIIEVIRKLSGLKDAKSVEYMKGQRMTDLE